MYGRDCVRETDKSLDACKKGALNEHMNPVWNDLAAKWFAPFEPKAKPSLRSG